VETVGHQDFGTLATAPSEELELTLIVVGGVLLGSIVWMVSLCEQRTGTPRGDPGLHKRTERGDLRGVNIGQQVRIGAREHAWEERNIAEPGRPDKQVMALGRQLQAGEAREKYLGENGRYKDVGRTHVVWGLSSR